MGFLPKDAPPIDYGNIPVTKLPPGEAFGARDLTTWALRRAQGQTGTGDAQTVVVKFRCKGCGAESSVLGARRIKRSRAKGDFKCRNCGGGAVTFLKTKALKVRRG